MIRRSLIALVLIAAASAAAAQVPTPDEYLGYPLGERFTTWDRILGYFEELPKRSDLITVQRFGQTYEGRPLAMAVITSPKNRAALEDIRRNVAALANGEADAARTADIAKSTPAVVWLGFGIHGNESNSAEAAMRVASTLLRDPESQQILDNLVVLIDPLQNPDGRERYVQWFHRARGAAPNANPDAFEHQEPWPGGRYNHYLIDMNRDWAWTSQQESRARVNLYRLWNPQVFVDFHEMGANNTYFFPPDAKPINANLPRDVEKWLEVFGRANAAEFSKRNWPFFVAETFDLFYPAYGDSWPALHGAVGMTYEVAGGGRGGTLFRREDGTNLTLAHRIEQHYTTAMTTLRTAAANREELLRYTSEAVRTQLETAKITWFVMPGSPNFEPLIEMLQREGVQVATLAAPVTVRAQRVEAETQESRTFPAGTAVITTRQPLGRLVQTLLEKSPTFPKGFLEAQRERAIADEPDEFYDLTTWSLPLAMNVEAYSTSAAVAAQTRPYEKAPRAAFRAAQYGYLVDGHEPNVYRLAGELLRNGIHFSVSDSDVTVADKTFNRGTLIVLKGNNRPDLDAALERAARDADAAVVPLDSGWMGGTAFGSEKIHYVKDPKIGLVGGEGTGATSYGMLWHTLDIDTPIPHTTLTLDSLRNIDFDHYEVLVFPDGSGYQDRLGKRGIEKLQAWIRGGGTLVAIKGASSFLREKDIEISKIKPWEPPKKPEDAKPTGDERYNDYRIPGSAFRTTINDRSYLTFGVPRPPSVLIEGSAAYLPATHRVDNIVSIAKDNPLVSGVAWPESIDRLKGSAFVVSEPYGKGTVITFADEPHFRLFWRGTLPLFLNAVLYSPSFPRD
jgi:hypothetical protein